MDFPFLVLKFSIRKNLVSNGNVFIKLDGKLMSERTHQAQYESAKILENSYIKLWPFYTLGTRFWLRRRFKLKA